MKDSIEIIREEIRCKIANGESAEYRSNTYYYNTQYLSWENARYMYADARKEEADEYLLYRALQEEKKLCASFYTKNEESIVGVFDEDKYDIYVRKLKSEIHKGFSIVCVTRKGCLADYFDIELIEDIYNENYIATGVLGCMENEPLINFFNGKCKLSGVEFDTYIDTGNPEEDAVLKAFGPSALIITGLLYGYPIESTLRIATRIFPYGY